MRSGIMEVHIVVSTNVRILNRAIFKCRTRKRAHKHTQKLVRFIPRDRCVLGRLKKSVHDFLYELVVSTVDCLGANKR